MFNLFFERVRAVTDIENQSDLARALGISTSGIAKAKKRGAVPSVWIFLLAEKYGLRAEWLLNGSGDPRPGGVMVAGQPLEALEKREWAGRDPNAEDPTPEPPATSAAIPESLPIAHAVAEIERAMRRIDLDDDAIWKAIKSMVDSKLGAQVYGYRPSRAEERPPMAAEESRRYGGDDPPEERRQGERRKPDPKNEIGTQR